jgi:pectin methylesterase-like acyl-CoA thioesterase
MRNGKILIIIGLCLFFFMQRINSLGIAAYREADIIVALDGSGDFRKIQDAINAAPSNNDHFFIIYLKRGVYCTEKLIVPFEKRNITIIGENREETIISYHIYNCPNGPDGRCPAEDVALWRGDLIRTSATLTIMGDGFRAENLTVENAAGPYGQAQAITVQADKVVFVNCNIKSYQDTLYLMSAGKRCYFEGCLIIGRTDYIYGACIAYFQSCEIRSWGKGWITAPSTPADQPYGFVFNECKLTYSENSPRPGDDGEPVRFGRPWHEFPKVAWLFCEMTGMIHPEGWGDTWRMNYASTSACLHLYEYKNTGPGAVMTSRAKWTGIRALTDEEATSYTFEKVLAGSDGWTPTFNSP